MKSVKSILRFLFGQDFLPVAPKEPLKIRPGRAIQEPLETSARDFARGVVAELADGKPVMRFAEAFGGSKVWPEMSNVLWRARVFELLGFSPLVGPSYFAPPDHLDDWVFVAYPLNDVPEVSRV